MVRQYFVKMYASQKDMDIVPAAQIRRLRKGLVVFMKRKLLAAAMVSTMFTGCGNKEEEGGSPDVSGESSAQQGTESNTEAETGAEGEEPAQDGEYPVVTMEYLLIGDTSQKQEIQDALNVILREKAQAEVELVGIEFANLVTQLNLMLTGGENSIDLFNSFWYTSESNLVSNGQVMALDDLLKEYGKDIQSVYEGYESYLNCGKIGDTLYGIPSVYAWCSQNEYIVYSEDVEKAGVGEELAKAASLEDITNVMVKLKEANPDKYYIPGATQTYWIPKSIDYLGDTNFLGVLTDPTRSTTVENYYESDYFRKFLENVKIWKEKGIISPDPMSNSDATLVNLQYGVANGTLGYNWDAQQGVDSVAASYGLNVTGAAVTDKLATTGDVTTYMWHISSFCKNPEAAMRVLNVLYSDEEAAKLVGQGIEGKNYVVTEDGRLSFPEGKSLFDCGWGPGGSALWPNITLCAPRDYEPVDIFEQMKAANASASKSLALGFQFDASPVADQMAACANVISQYYIPLIMGEADIDAVLPEFQQALHTAGIDDIIKEKQSQLDSWLAIQ